MKRPEFRTPGGNRNDANSADFGLRTPGGRSTSSRCVFFERRAFDIVFSLQTPCSAIVGLLRRVSFCGVNLHKAIPYGNYVTCAWRGGIRHEGSHEAGVHVAAKPIETDNWSPAPHTSMVPEGSHFGFLLPETHTTDCAHPPAFATFFDMRNHQQPISISTFNSYLIDPITMRPVDSSWCRQSAR